MGFFEKIFGKAPKAKGQYKGFFKMLDGYRPVFTSFSGSVYEAELVRSAINSIATHVSKLKVETKGAARPALRNKLRKGPNEFQTWSQFLYRTATILYVHNTAFIVPVFDDFGEPSGIYTVLPTRCEVVEYNGVAYLRYEFGNGQKASVELAYCGIMTRFQYKSDLFGESNHALYPTMDLISMQNQGIKEGVKNAASYRFMARLTNFLNEEDLALERKRFTAKNFSADAEGGGMLLFPNTYTDIRQVDTKPFVVDADQMKVIEENVWNYFGVNAEIMQNKAYGDAWNAFYEGVIEPFAIQFSEAMTKMLFTCREQAQGSMVMATSNRLQYMSNADKLNYSVQLLDRGMLTLNEAREVWNLPPLENGDVRIIRGEYYNADSKTEVDPNVTEDSDEQAG